MCLTPLAWHHTSALAVMLSNTCTAAHAACSTAWRTAACSAAPQLVHSLQPLVCSASACRATCGLSRARAPQHPSLDQCCSAAPTLQHKQRRQHLVHLHCLQAGASTLQLLRHLHHSHAVTLRTATLCAEICAARHATNGSMHRNRRHCQGGAHRVAHRAACATATKQ